MGAMHIYLGDAPNSLDLFFKAKNIFEQAGAHEKVANVYNSIAAAYSSMAENDKALSYFEKSYEINKKHHNEIGIARYFYNTGTIYHRKGIYAKALGLIHESQKIYERIGSQKEMADVFNNLGSIYSEVGDPHKSLEYYQKALEIYKNMSNWPDVASTLENIGNSYRLLDSLNLALNFYKESLQIHQTIDNQVKKIFCLNNMGMIYMDMKDYKNAFDCWRQAAQIHERVENPTLNISSIIQTARWFIEVPDSLLYLTNTSPKERWQKSESLLLQADTLVEKTQLLMLKSVIWQALSKTYEEQGNFIGSLRAYEKYILFRDSIEGQDIKNQITRKEIQFEFDKKETVLKFEQQLTFEQLAQQKLLSIQQQQTLRLNQQSLALSNKEADLQRLAYLKEKAEKQEKEQALSLAGIDKQLQDVQLGALLQEKALQLKTLAEKNALIGFLLAGISAVLLAFAAFYWWIRQRQAKKEAAIQAQFTRQLLENIEDDRGRIAIDLHDSVSHELLLLKQSIRKEITGPEVGDKIDGIINGIRQISRNLHPVMLDKIGLQLSLETLCEQFMLHETMYVSHEIDYQNTLSKSAELQLFRIVQEGLTNALKYSKAEAVKVQIKHSSNALRLEIQDNGKGFDVEKALEGGKAFGLHSIIQRAKAIGGKAEIRSGVGGTTIIVVIG
jgi:signal transduction histidine kinase/Tfp pilus assembly protein PilF